MKVLSHRGYWKSDCEKNSESAFRRSFQLGFGTETDLRDLNGEMISPEDSSHTYSYQGHYKILPAIYNWSRDPERIAGGELVPEGFSYTSDNNKEWMSQDALKSWITDNTEAISIPLFAGLKSSLQNKVANALRLAVG